MAADLPFEVVVHAQGAREAVVYVQPFENAHAALACVKHETGEGRVCTLRIRRSAIAEPIKPIGIGNR